MDVAANLADVKRRIDAATLRAGRPANSVELIAVSKTVAPDLVRAAYDAGQRAFGENRIQDFESRRDDMQFPGAVWHFIGHLQSNKAARAAQLFDIIHTVDNVPLAERLALQRQKSNAPPLPVLIEVKLSDEATKTGAAESDVAMLADAIRKIEHLQLRGLMTMPPWSTDSQVARPYFQRLAAIARSIGVEELSMGMTNDFETAIEEGSTMVRVGTAIFGKRKP